MRGRKPTPTKLKLLKGERKDRINRNEPDPKTEIPDPPEHLNEVALKEWDRITNALHLLGMISQLDMALLAGYCTAFARWKEAEEYLKKTGPVIKTKEIVTEKVDPETGEITREKKGGNFIQSPFLPVANRAMEQMHKFAVEFGLSTSSRSRISVDASDKPKQGIARFIK